MRSIGAVALIVSGVLACSTALSIEGGSAPVPDDGGPSGEGAAPDGDTLPDGAPRPDAGDADAGNADAGTPFELVRHPNEELVGVAATNDRVFFTSKTASSIRVSQDGVTTLVRAGEPSVGGIKVIGNDIYWARPNAGGDFGGVYKLQIGGSTRLRATIGDHPGCRAFTFVPNNLYFCASAGSMDIRKDQGAQTTVWASSTSVVRFLATTPDSTSVFWTDETRIMRGAPGDAFVLPETTPTLMGITPVGIAVHAGFLYFTETSGAVRRAGLDGSNLATVYAPASAPATIGDITITPDGTRAYWAQGETIMGLVLP